MTRVHGKSRGKSQSIKPMNPKSDWVKTTPEQINEWEDILHLLPIVESFWISTKVPIFVSSPILHPYRLTNE